MAPIPIVSRTEMYNFYDVCFIFQIQSWAQKPLRLNSQCVV